jgi:hypothetical protein
MRGIVEKIRTKLDVRPFKPFTIFTSDGKAATVKDPAFAWIHPAGRTMYVCSDPTSDADEIIHLMHVTKLAIDSVRQSQNRRNK